MSELIEDTQKQGGQEDRFEQNYQESLKRLKECQESLGRNSCFFCEKVLECEIRKTYVKDVYTRLNHGEEGGFEF